MVVRKSLFIDLSCFLVDSQSQIKTESYYKTYVYLSQNDASFKEGRTLGEVYELSPPEYYSDMTYEESEQMVEWLIDQYSIQQVFEAYYKNDFEEVFGKSAEELYTEWIQYINYHFSTLIRDN